MRPTRDIERLLIDWLGEQPDHAPDRVIARAVSQAHATRQRRRWPSLIVLRSPFMSASLRVAAALVAVVVVAAVAVTMVNTRSPAAGGPTPPVATPASTGPTPPPSSASSPATSAALPSVQTAPPAGSVSPIPVVGGQTFTSARSHYSIEVPAAWLVSAHPGTAVFPFLGNDTGTDNFSNPGAAKIELAVLAVAAGTTLASWEALTASLDHDPSGMCLERPPAQSIRAAGGAALLLQWDCSAAYRTQFSASFVHAGSGYYVVWSSPPGNAANDEGTFLGILATVRFQ